MAVSAANPYGEIQIQQGRYYGAKESFKVLIKNQWRRELQILHIHYHHYDRVI